MGRNMNFKDITIFIPSYKRWDSIKTHKIVDECVVVVPKSQEEKYRKCNKDINLLICPDEIEGNIARKRNWIKRNCKTRYLMMMDDDLLGFQKVINMKQIKMKKWEIKEMFLQGFLLMEDIGAIMWGVNLNTDPLCYREYSPFSLIAPVLGPFVAMRNVNDIWYDERLPLKEDYDLSLQVLFKYRKILRMNRYSYDTVHLTNASGGCVDYRSLERELMQNKMLLKKWGKRIVKFDMEKSINPKLHIPLKGI